jgi:hypothetical protein
VKLGRWLTITNFGRIDGLGDPETIPPWILSEEGRSRVVIIIVTQGWVVNGVGRHAEPLGDNDPPQLCQE